MSNLQEHLSEQAAITAACETRIAKAKSEGKPYCANCGSTRVVPDHPLIHVCEFCEDCGTKTEIVWPVHPEPGPKSNERRADEAASLLRVMEAITGEEGLQTALVDTLTHLMHFCRFNGFSFAQALASAKVNYVAEVFEGPDFQRPEPVREAS